ncbi:hypothetical protein ACEQPO_02930 [Bacillus sp. SL00103]
MQSLFCNRLMLFRISIRTHLFNQAWFIYLDGPSWACPLLDAEMGKKQKTNVSLRAEWIIGIVILLLTAVFTNIPSPPPLHLSRSSAQPSGAS